MFVVTLKAEPSLGPIGGLMARLVRGVADTENRKTVQNAAELVAREQGGGVAIPDPALRERPLGPAALRARTLLRADAAFELALGLPLATGALTGLHDELDLPEPASGTVVTAFGAALIPFAGPLLRESRTPGRPGCRHSPPATRCRAACWPRGWPAAATT